tara:strand:- start:72 stop:254 length:183 start_codon:yes stop_codon:yes gene_type:complete
MLKLKKQYAGCYKVEGHDRDYEIFIERSCDDPKYWRCDGHYFSILAEAKAFMFTELEAAA